MSDDGFIVSSYFSSKETLESIGFNLEFDKGIFEISSKDGEVIVSTSDLSIISYFTYAYERLNDVGLLKCSD